MMDIFAAAALGASCVAGAFGVRAATIHIRDNIDEFINDLHRQGRWASAAAILAAISSGLQAAAQFVR